MALAAASAESPLAILSIVELLARNPFREFPREHQLIRSEGDSNWLGGKRRLRFDMSFGKRSDGSAVPGKRWMCDIMCECKYPSVWLRLTRFEKRDVTRANSMAECLKGDLLPTKSESRDI